MEDTPQMSFLDKAKDVAGDLADKAGELAEKAGDKIPDSVKSKAGDLAGKAGDLAGKVVEKVPDSVKDKAGDLAGKAGDLVGKATGKLGLSGDDEPAVGEAGGEPATPSPAGALSRAPVSDRVRQPPWHLHPTRRRGSRRRRRRAVGRASAAIAGRRAEAGDQRLHRRAADVGDRASGARRAGRRRCRPCPSPGRPRRRPR